MKIHENPLFGRSFFGSNFFFGEMLKIGDFEALKFLYVCHKFILDSVCSCFRKRFWICEFFSLHLHSGMDIRILHDIGVDLDL